jgi:hypothetical protein
MAAISLLFRYLVVLRGKGLKHSIVDRLAKASRIESPHAADSCASRALSFILGV